jgi:hypothetical protein
MGTGQADELRLGRRTNPGALSMEPLEGSRWRGAQSGTQWLKTGWLKRGKVHRDQMVGPWGLEPQTSTVSRYTEPVFTITSTNTVKPLNPSKYAYAGPITGWNCSAVGGADHEEA